MAGTQTLLYQEVGSRTLSWYCNAGHMVLTSIVTARLNAFTLIQMTLAPSPNSLHCGRYKILVLTHPIKDDVASLPCRYAVTRTGANIRVWAEGTDTTSELLSESEAKPSFPFPIPAGLMAGAAAILDHEIKATCWGWQKAKIEVDCFSFTRHRPVRLSPRRDVWQLAHISIHTQLRCSTCSTPCPYR